MTDACGDQKIEFVRLQDAGGLYLQVEVEH